MHLLIDMMNSEVEIRVEEAGKSAYDFLFHKSINSLTVTRVTIRQLSGEMSSRSMIRTYDYGLPAGTRQAPKPGKQC
jgi:hypothetical protein